MQFYLIIDFYCRLSQALQRNAFVVEYAYRKSKRDEKNDRCYRLWRRKSSKRCKSS